MIRLPPRSTRTDTLFPYTTLCRSQLGDGVAGDVVLGGSEPAAHDHRVGTAERVAQHLDDAPPVVAELRLAQVLDARQGELPTDPRGVGVDDLPQPQPGPHRDTLTSPAASLPQAGRVLALAARAEERRVGQECGSPCRCVWGPEKK